MYHNSANTIEFVSNYDPEIAALMSEELTRQRRNIELIASENIASPAVIAAMGTILTNKYAEGLPGKRYYGGCEHVDEVERVCIRRACELFGAASANVQPHSGAQANLAVYAAFLQPGDTIVGMDPAETLTKRMTIDLAKERTGSTGHAILVGDSIYDHTGAVEAGIDFLGVLYGFGFGEGNAYPFDVVMTVADVGRCLDSEGNA